MTFHQAINSTALQFWAYSMWEGEGKKARILCQRLTGVLGTITAEKERKKEKRRERESFFGPRGLLVLSKIHAQAEEDASALILPDSKCHQNLNYTACSLSRSMRVCFNLYRPPQTAAEEPVGAKEGEWGLRGGK